MFFVHQNPPAAEPKEIKNEGIIIYERLNEVYMNVIKIYLSEGGSVADIKSNFPLYQGAYQNKLLNVFVPTSIIAQQTDAPVTTAVKIGMIYTGRTG